MTPLREKMRNGMTGHESDMVPAQEIILIRICPHGLFFMTSSLTDSTQNTPRSALLLSYGYRGFNSDRCAPFSFGIYTRISLWVCSNSISLQTGYLCSISMNSVGRPVDSDVFSLLVSIFFIHDTG